MASKSFTIPTIFKAVDQMTGTISGIQKSVQNFANASSVGLARAERGFRSLISPLTSINRLLGGFGVYIGAYSFTRILAGAIAIFSNFQQANANLAAVMGTTVQKNVALAESAKYLGLTTAKTASEVVGLQIELAKLGFNQEQILNMQRHIIQGSIALDGSLDRTTLLVGAMTRTFQEFSMTGSDTQHLMDMMSLSVNDTALDFKKLETGLPIVGGAANAVGLSFANTIALLGALSNAGIDASMSATALRNILIDSKRKGHTYDQVLGNIAKHVDTLTPAFDKFGRRTAVSAQILVKHLKDIQKETVRLTNVQLGYSDSLSTQRLNTYQGSLIQLKAAYQGFILSIEDGTGPYAAYLTNLMKTLRAMLLLITNTPAAREQLLRMNTDITLAAMKWVKWLEIIGKVTLAIIAIKAVIVVWSAAMSVLTFVINAVRVAQWLWNAAMLANPIGLIIAGVAALVIWLTYVIRKWNEWGQGASLLMGPLGIILMIVKNIFDYAGGIANAFKNGLLPGLAQIGLVIMKSLLTPMKQLYELMAKIPGFGFAGELAKKLGVAEVYLNKAIAKNGAAPEEEKYQMPASSPLQQLYMLQRAESVQKQNVSIELKNNAPGWSMNTQSDNDLVPIKVSSTMMPWGN